MTVWDHKRNSQGNGSRVLILEWNDSYKLHTRMQKMKQDQGCVASRGANPLQDSRDHRTTVFRQAAILLRAEASSWRRRNYKSLLLTLLSTLCIVLFIWSFEEAIEVFNGMAGSVSMAFGGPAGHESAGSIPSCKDDVFMDPKSCYTVIFAPDTSEFRDVVDRMVRGCRRSRKALLALLVHHAPNITPCDGFLLDL